MLVRELLQHLSAALGIGAVILGDNLDRPAIDAALAVDLLHGGLGRAAIPTPIGGADAGGMLLEADLDRRIGLGGSEAPGQRRCGKQAARGCAFQQCTAVSGFLQHWDSPIFAAGRGPGSPLMIKGCLHASGLSRSFSGSKPHAAPQAAKGPERCTRS